MNNEEFNDAMCKLRQAEENLHEALRNVAVAINEDERKPQKFQENNDDDYYKGLKDMHEALRLIATDGSDGGMSIYELKDAFGTASVCDIILGYSPLEIIDKTLAWTTKRKESQELHVGDEIEYTYPGRKPEKCIVIGLDDGMADAKNIWMISSDLSSGRSWFSSKCIFGDSYRKTGKHYDAIPFPKEIK